jgi:hypothetical protein
MTIGEVKWGGHHPYPNDGDVTEIVIWVGFNNSGSNQGGIASIWIESSGMSPFYPEEQLTPDEREEIRVLSQIEWVATTKTCPSGEPHLLFSQLLPPTN